MSRLGIDPAARERPAPNRRLFALIALGAAALLALLLVYAMRGRPPAVTVATAREAGAGDAAILNASGYVTPQRRATVSAKITGKIKDVLIEEGMHVKAGQVLAHLDDVDAMAALRAAQAQDAVARASLADVQVKLANARRTLERDEKLRQGDFVSAEELDDARTTAASLEAQVNLANEQIEAAQRSVDIARQNVDNCTIRAPFDGVIVSKDAQPGEMVSPMSAGGGFTRTGIATVVDMSSLEVEVDVGEAYIARVTPGQRVLTVLDAYPNWEIPSKVVTVIPTADRQKATVKVRIAFDQLDPRILPDMGVKVSFLEGAPDSSAAAAAAVLVPRDALRHDGDQTFVFVVNDGRAERRAVRAGRDRGTEVEVLAGLRAGESVVTQSSSSLQDGARVAEAK